VEIGFACFFTDNNRLQLRISSDLIDVLLGRGRYPVLDLICAQCVITQLAIVITGEGQKIDHSEQLKLGVFHFVIIYVLPILSSF
jgi:hypothetical protein